MTREALDYHAKKGKEEKKKWGQMELESWKERTRN